MERLMRAAWWPLGPVFAPLGGGYTRHGCYGEGSKTKVDTRADTLDFVAIVFDGRSAEI
jgi:hypothetical protein